MVSGVYYWKKDQNEPEIVAQNTPTTASVRTSIPREVTQIENQNKSKIVKPGSESKAVEVAYLAQNPLWERYQQAEVKEIFALTLATSDIKRRKALDALFDRASAADLNFLYDYLKSDKPKLISYEEHYANINNILDFLLLEHKDIGRTESTLLTLLENHETDHFTKMAIVQRLDVLHEKGEEQELVEGHLWQLSTLKGSRLAAIAISSLTRLSINTTDIDSKALENRIIDILKQDDADELTQVVALQIATWMDLPSVEALAEKFLIPEKPSITLQLAAVNTFYKRKNISRLQQLSNNKDGVDEDVREALKNAIALLNEENL